MAVFTVDFCSRFYVIVMKHGQECCMSNKAQRVGSRARPIQHEAKPSVVWCLETPH